jgi:hypothetical protein
MKTMGCFQGMTPPDQRHAFSFRTYRGFQLHVPESLITFQCFSHFNN